MAIAQSSLPSPVPPQPMTYEDYMAEGEINLRYDILDGVRFVTNPNRRHQRILRNIARPFEDYETVDGSGQVITAPCDILISRTPLRTRQPDVLFMSNACVSQNPPLDDPAPLDPAPELVVEIVSTSDTRAVLATKLADYQQVGVRECWIVYPGLNLVEVLRLTETQITLVATYGSGQEVQSEVFQGLSVAADAIFAV